MELNNVIDRLTKYGSGTRYNPSCYHSALEYLSAKTGIPERKEIKIKSMAGLRSKSGKSLLYKSDRIFVIDKDGNRFTYMQAGPKRFDQAGIVADHFLVEVNRGLQEFGIPIKSEGQYKDSLGGGWHQMVSLYSIDGYFFADMDCTC